MAVDGKYIHEIEKAPSLLDDDALFVVGYNKLTGATTLGQIKKSITGDLNAPSNNLFYSSKYVDDRLTEVNERINNNDITVNTVKNNINELRTYVDQQDNSLLKKIKENAANIEKDRNHWQHVLYGDDTTNIDATDTGIIPALSGDTLALKKSLYGGTILKDSDGNIKDTPERIYKWVNNSYPFEINKYAINANNGTVPDLYASVEKLNNRLVALYKLLFNPGPNKETALFTTQTIDGEKIEYSFDQFRSPDVRPYEKISYSGQIDRLWYTLYNIIFSIGTKVDYMFKNIAGEGKTPSDSDIGLKFNYYEMSLGQSQPTMHTVNVPFKNITLGDICAYFGQTALDIKSRGSTFSRNSNALSCLFGDSTNSEFINTDIKRFIESISNNNGKVGLHESAFTSLKYDASMNPNIGELEEILKNKDLDSENVDPYLTDISLLKMAVKRIESQLCEIIDKAYFSSSISNYTKSHNVDNTNTMPSSVTDDPLRKIDVGTEPPVWLSAGEIYLQYFE